jgi:hypothetical protein
MQIISYIPIHVIPQEVVPPEIYSIYGDRSWQFMDARILWTIDSIRDYFGRAIKINNWHTKGSFRYRGFRPPNYVGVILSQHRFGRAVDFDIDGMSAHEVRDVILSDKKLDFKMYITAIELGVNWVHIDCRNVNLPHILTFNAGGV